LKAKDSATVSPVHFLQHHLQVRLVAGRKLSFIFDLRTVDEDATRRAPNWPLPC